MDYKQMEIWEGSTNLHGNLIQQDANYYLFPVSPKTWSQNLDEEIGKDGIKNLDKEEDCRLNVGTEMKQGMVENCRNTVSCFLPEKKTGKER